jgi:hypothetical protein
MSRDETPWLTALDSREIEILGASIESGLMKLMVVYPKETEMWHEHCDLLGDLHKSWEIVFPKEKT